MYRNLNVESLGVSGRQSELIELALTYKFRGLDLDMAAFAKQVELRGAEHAQRFLQSSGIRVGGFPLPVRWQGDDEVFRADLQKLEAVATVAAEVGAKGCYTNVMAASDERPFQDNFEFHRARFSEIAEVLAPHGVRLGLGFLAPSHHRKDRQHQFISTADALLTLMKMVVGSNVGVCLDLWHWHLGGGTVEQVRELSADQIVLVRVADLPAGADAETATEEQRLLPGSTGVVPAAAVLKHLSEIEYGGPVTPYPHPKQFSGTTRDQTVLQTADALKKVWPSVVAAPLEAEQADQAETTEAAAPVAAS